MIREMILRSALCPSRFKIAAGDSNDYDTGQRE